MKDFLTRVAERALGTAPRIDPQATSRYAPARLPLPELPPPRAEMPASRVTSRAPHFGREHELPKKVIAPGLEPTPEVEERIAVPEQPRKIDQSPLPSLSERLPRTNEPEPEPEFTPERITGTSVVASVPRDTENHPTHVFTAPLGSDEVETPEVLDRPAQIFPPRALSIVENKAAPEATRERRSLKIVERIIDEPNEIEESIESSSPAPVEVVVEKSAKVSRPREHQQPARAAVAPIVPPPTAATDRRPHDRPERREKKIQVKIGRVEVHAPPAPVTPVEPPAAPGPKVSLAEFLRQHNRRRDE